MYAIRSYYVYQRFVAALVAVGVVELLEVVQVEQGHAERALATGGAADFLAEHLFHRITSYNVCYTKLLRAPRVEVWHDYDAQSHNLSIAFCVVQNEDFHCNEEFKNSPFNWKLWEWDVVEAFLQLRSDEEDKNAPYLEIQVSPLNQRLLLIITKSYNFV